MHIDQHDFLKWAESRDPNEEYVYVDNYNCPLGQYLRDRGIPFSAVLGRVVVGENGDVSDIPVVLARCLPLCFTFGDLARDLRERLGTEMEFAR